MPESAEVVEFGGRRPGSLLDAALDSSEVASLIFDPKANRTHHFSKALSDLTGLPGYKLARQKVSDLFPDQLPILIGVTDACLETGSAWTDKLSVKQADGNKRAVDIFASRFNEAGKDLVLFVLLDKKALKSRHYEAEFDQLMRAEQPQSKQLEGMFRTLERGNRLILDAAGEGIYGVDKDGKTTFVNPAAERMLGWSAEELVGRVMHAVVHHSHEDGTPYSLRCCPIYEAFKDGAVHRVDNEVFWRKDGSSFPVEYTSTPIRHRGKMVGAVVVFRDISERRQADWDLKSALEEVEKLKKRLELENAYLLDELREEYKHGEIVGNSNGVKQILRQIELVAPTDANVLITGESGTGKELIARAIHQSSSRQNRPLIRVNCAAIPRELFESEFFGHKKGAFTGAVSERVGRFELADGGTLFLDEVGELPLEQQAKFLRVLQDQQFERLGDTETREVDVRIIAATNDDLKGKVREKAFREDLFFRLNVFPIEAPPLRDRLEDIPFLAAHFMKLASSRLNKPPISISLADIERLQAYDWPGNIREFENVIERAVIVSGQGKLCLDLPGRSDARSVQPEPRANGNCGFSNEQDRLAREKQDIIEALGQANGKVSGAGGAAELLGVKPTTLYSRLKRFGINAREHRG